MSLPCTVSLERGETLVEGTHQNVLFVQEQIRTLLGLDHSNPLDCIKFIENAETGKTISPEIKKVIEFLYPSIDIKSATDQSLLSEKYLQLSYLETASKLKKPASTDFTHEVCQVPLIVASFMIEILGVSNSFPHQADKNFAEGPVYSLYLPIPVFVRFRSYDDTTVNLSVSNFPSLPNDVAKSLVSHAVQAVSEKTVIISHYLNVDIEGLDRESLQKLSQSSQLYIVKSKDVFSHDPSFKNLYRSFDLYAVPYHVNGLNDQHAKTYHNSCESIFNEISRRQCSECNREMSAKSKCITYKHKGKRIPFDNGKMEDIQRNVDGENTTFVKFSCCSDRVFKIDDNSDGCVEVQGAHKFVGNTLSKWVEEQQTTLSAL
ncbi:hypothetical protein TRFO_35298 [Tritrichomonas foetus]|uniref:Uncharacterized protein n=1 Tax=Tritrichomonas foetus TaxID=1144522 RepID=A0A1J4JL54_9EUKA|nr:hypothetical protein TRFO_35298 [Tritrichomonas foetus]|eukprot:OHS98299.1 hypothetical protein TRFO_35298 [Tritrichomonas foetus]